MYWRIPVLLIFKGVLDCHYIVAATIGVSLGFAGYRKLKRAKDVRYQTQTHKMLTT